MTAPALPQGWTHISYDEIGNPAGYRIHKNHVTTFRGTTPVYHAYMPNRGYLGAFPLLPDAVSACDVFSARHPH